MSYRIPLLHLPVLAGALVLVLSACRRDARSDSIDTTAVPNDTTTSQNAPPALPPELPSSLDRERMQGEPMDRLDRQPVAGRDEAIDLGVGGSSAGSSGTHSGTGGTAGYGGAGSH